MHIVHCRGEADDQPVIQGYDEVMARIVEEFGTPLGDDGVVEDGWRHLVEDGTVSASKQADLDGHRPTFSPPISFLARLESLGRKSMMARLSPLVQPAPHRRRATADPR
jgi:hypothetical protein